MVQISEVRVGHDAANRLNSTPHRLRFENFQSIQDAGDKTIRSSKHQAIDALEDRSFGRFALQDVELMAQNKDLRLKPVPSTGIAWSAHMPAT